MDIEKEAEKARRFQHIYESIFLVLGFAALFSWYGAIELKLVLALILTRVCFSWGEMAALQNQINFVSREVLKRNGIIQGILLSLKEEVLRINNPERKNFAIQEILKEHQAAIDSAESNFEIGYKQQLVLERINESMFANSIFPEVLGLVVQIALAGVVGWIISLLIA